MHRWKARSRPLTPFKAIVMGDVYFKPFNSFLNQFKSEWKSNDLTFQDAEGMILDELSASCWHSVSSQKTAQNTNPLISCTKRSSGETQIPLFIQLVNLKDDVVLSCHIFGLKKKKKKRLNFTPIFSHDYMFLIRFLWTGFSDIVETFPIFAYFYSVNYSVTKQRFLKKRK